MGAMGQAGQAPLLVSPIVEYLYYYYQQWGLPIVSASDISIPQIPNILVSLSHGLQVRASRGRGRLREKYRLK
jgi:hypothetical protein